MRNIFTSGGRRVSGLLEITQSWSRKKVHYKIRQGAPRLTSDSPSDTRGKLYIINLLEISDTEENRKTGHDSREQRDKRGRR